MSEQLVSTDPNYGASAPPQGAHPEATIGAGAARPGSPTFRGDTESVTLGDLRANPAEAMQRIGMAIKKELTDPKTWLQAAALYFGPKIFNVAAPVVARAAASAGKGAVSGAIRGTAAVGDVVSPDVIGALSPRAGKVVEVAQRMRGAMTPEAPPVASVPAAPAEPVPPAPVAPPTRAASPAARPVKPAPKPHLTLDEFQAASRLIKQGYDKAEVLKAIQRQKLPASWLNLPDDAEVAAAVQDRNASGRWPE